MITKAQFTHPTAVPARIVGAVTVVYSIAILIKPTLLSNPAGLTGAVGNARKAVPLLVRAVGARDVVLGGRMLIAAPGSDLRDAALSRAVADAADAVLFGFALSTADRKVKIAGFAAAWAALSAWTAVKAGSAPALSPVS